MCLKILNQFENLNQFKKFKPKKKLNYNRYIEL